MTRVEMIDLLERNPVIAAVRQDKFDRALASPAEVIFCLDARLPDIREQTASIHTAGKRCFVHMDLAEGIGKDRTGLEYVASVGADGIISTRGQIIRLAKECGLLTVQRFFALDSQGIESIHDLLANSSLDFMEIMPGVINKVIRRFANGTVPVIAGGLIETKDDVTGALSAGAAAVSTGCEPLWYL